VTEHPDPGEASPPLVIVVSGPSGVGKDALLARVRGRDPRYVTPVTQTTRDPRPGEVDGRDYIFVSHDQFAADLAGGELLEHAQVYENFYGVPRSQLRQALASGLDVIMRVDVQGARTLRALLPGALFLFLAPEDPDQLERQLRARGYEDERALRIRLAMSAGELDQQDTFDYVVINREGDLEGTAERVLAILERERARRDRVAVVV